MSALGQKILETWTSLNGWHVLFSDSVWIHRQRRNLMHIGTRLETPPIPSDPRDGMWLWVSHFLSLGCWTCFFAKWRSSTAPGMENSCYILLPSQLLCLWQTSQINHYTFHLRLSIASESSSTVLPEAAAPPLLLLPSYVSIVYYS